jgi:caa(3)-type oxidase subunit IV
MASHANHKAGHGAGHGGHHAIPITKLVGTLIFLAVMMVATIAWAQFAHAYPKGIGPLSAAQFSYLNNFIAMGIAVVKAIAVVNIFMGVKFASNLVKTYAILGFAWFLSMFFMFCDYGTRHWEPVQGWTGENTLAMPRAYEPKEPGLPPRDKIVIPEYKGH